MHSVKADPWYVMANTILQPAAFDTGEAPRMPFPVTLQKWQALGNPIASAHDVMCMPVSQTQADLTRCNVFLHALSALISQFSELPADSESVLSGIGSLWDTGDGVMAVPNMLLVYILTSKGNWMSRLEYLGSIP
jgi:hypothetical protein